MVEMKTYSPRQVHSYLCDEPKLQQLAQKFVKELLDANVTVQLANVTLNYAWYMVVGSGSLMAKPDWKGEYYTILST